ncbi:hypothetical protein HaLaN_29960 [Haematococcus lacustris]|uniref:Uncharacterized protein n=1 Tax=Haematococcus lacustris TaxID=44745 RepID=A0A6A0AG40_HAELA|nr:hypothetical protein HaLaN_29960 [Haematococcus lacustris]
MVVAGTNEGLFEQEQPSEVPLEEMGPCQ